MTLHNMDVPGDNRVVPSPHAVDRGRSRSNPSAAEEREVESMKVMIGQETMRGDDFLVEIREVPGGLETGRDNAGEPGACYARGQRLLGPAQGRAMG